MPNFLSIDPWAFVPTNSRNVTYSDFVYLPFPFSCCLQQKRLDISYHQYIALLLPVRCYASTGNSDRNVSVHLSVCLSVMRPYCVKTKKASVMISSPSGSPTILVY